ncbi:Pyrroline-5-carboxylate reductase [Novipirellula aureliae]|uniref:Pyrroline-5-carboxylate reductase n=1 Tax=Novipirellula aureliae TaxID=2527966 RepID=A0A5C6EEN2_9BACT|nr:pyrroline-5-carboxylate reductase [Novipirellula aureliae]TWU45689.1 Pyrroline-5-carboxylate reductase [Novipirellula aureliae]
MQEKPTRNQSLSTLTLIGGGQMGRALIGGMLDRDVIQENDIRVIDPGQASQAWWQENRPAVAVRDTLEAASVDSDIVLFAVKPYLVAKVAKQPAGFWDGKLVVSIAAGITLEKLCGLVGHQRVVRVMPNTPSLVGAGAAGFCAAKDVLPSDKQWIETALGSVGLAVEIEDSQMDALTAVSGSGPAYVCLIVEAMADGGVLAGLPRDLALKLATQTVLGTAKMIAETGRHPAELKDAVASPAGTTIAALQVLEQNGLRAALIDAVATAARRSKELH